MTVTENNGLISGEFGNGILGNYNVHLPIVLYVELTQSPTTSPTQRVPFVKLQHRQSTQDAHSLFICSWTHTRKLE